MKFSSVSLSSQQMLVRQAERSKLIEDFVPKAAVWGNLQQIPGPHMLLYRTTCGVLLSFPGKQCLGGWALSATEMDELISAGFCTQLLVSLPGSGFCVEWADLGTSREKKSIRRGKISVSSTGCSLGAEEMQIPLDFFTADCCWLCLLSPLLLDGHCSKTSAYSQCCHSACVSAGDLAFIFRIFLRHWGFLHLGSLSRDLPAPP